MMSSFNGNLEGMLSPYELVSTYSGRKVIITPACRKYTRSQCFLIAQKMDTVFDMVIITGKVISLYWMKIFTMLKKSFYTIKHYCNLYWLKKRFGDLIPFQMMHQVLFKTIFCYAIIIRLYYD